MILVDTSVWVAHFRKANPNLARYLQNNQVLVHPFVIGELACGTLRDRAKTLYALRSLPMAPVIGDIEVLHFLETRRLSGLGIGWVDVHLLASTILTSSRIWTTDKALHAAACALKMAF